jgi:hypothetical protein
LHYIARGIYYWLDAGNWNWPSITWPNQSAFYLLRDLAVLQKGAQEAIHKLSPQACANRAVGVKVL